MNLKTCFTDVYPWLLAKNDPNGTEPCLRDMIAEYYYRNMSITAQEADEYADRYIQAWIETAEGEIDGDADGLTDGDIAFFTNVGVENDS